MPAYTLRIRRQDDEDAEPYWVEGTVELDAHRSVLDALIELRQAGDGPAIRYSCRAAICGSCGVRVNGLPDLACHRQLGRAQAEAGEGAPIVVEPMGNMPVLRDLIVDMDAVHWAKVRRVEPWLVPAEPEPDREHVVAHDVMVDLTQTQACIQCGACVSNCMTLEVDPLFVGPAALAKAFRFANDPRDARSRERAEDLAQDPHGMYDCTHCFMCIDACPKGVAPMSQIVRLRRLANREHGIVDRNNGHRHEHGFVKNVRANGLLNEADLMLDSYGRYSLRGVPTLLESLPVVATALWRRKIGREAIGHPHRKSVGRDVRRLVDRVTAQDEQVELKLYVTPAEE
jgi:succinate dehydrogenase / fumarate reductase iron-sulfur subunit